MRLRPPDPRWMEFLFPDNRTWVARSSLGFFRWSEFAAWLHRKMPASITSSGKYTYAGRMETLSLRPRYEYILDDWNPYTRAGRLDVLLEDDPPRVFRETLEFVEFALRQFQQRADIDGGSTVILSAYDMGDGDSRYSVRLNEIAGRLGTPVINQHDYIAQQRGRVEDAHFHSESHWNATGHQWAAEALLEYLKENQEICD